MPRWPSKKDKEEVEIEDTIEEETPLEVEETPLENNIEDSPITKERVEIPVKKRDEGDNEVLIATMEQHMSNVLSWGNDLTGAISRAVEYRSSIVVSEKDITMIDFCMRVISYTDPRELVELLQQEGAKEKENAE